MELLFLLTLLLNEFYTEVIQIQALVVDTSCMLVTIQGYQRIVEELEIVFLVDGIQIQDSVELSGKLNLDGIVVEEVCSVSKSICCPLSSGDFLMVYITQHRSANSTIYYGVSLSGKNASNRPFPTGFWIVFGILIQLSVLAKCLSQKNEYV